MAVESSVVAVETMTCEQLNNYLICQGIHSDVTTILTDKLFGDSELFVAMCEDDKEVSKGQL